MDGEATVADAMVEEAQQRLRRGTQEDTTSSDWLASSGGPPLKEWEAAALLELLHVDRQSRKAGMAFMKAYLAKEGVVLDDNSLEHLKQANQWPKGLGALSGDDRQNACQVIGFNVGRSGSPRLLQCMDQMPPGAWDSKKPEGVTLNTWESCKEQLGSRLKDKGRLTAKDMRDVMSFFQQARVGHV